jgi:hypothetical protein
MANEALINLVKWCKNERASLVVQLDALKTAKFRTHSNDGSGWVETTQENISRVEANMAELDQILFDYDSKTLKD